MSKKNEEDAAVSDVIWVVVMAFKSASNEKNGKKNGRK
jgi:hypothetical protein